MGLEVAFEICAVSYRFTHERLAHDEGIEQEVAHEHAQGEDYDGRVRGNLSGFRRNEVGRIHGPHHEGREERHHQTSNQGQHNAFLLVCLGHIPVALAAGGDTVGHDGAHHEDNTQHQQGHIARLGALGHCHAIVVHHTHHQGDTDAQGEGYRHAGQGNRGRQQDVGGIEDDTAHQDPKDTGSRRLRQVGQEGAAFRADAAQRKGQ